MSALSLVEQYIQDALSDLGIPDTCKILVATSGGPDSIALCHALKRLNFQIGLAHVNYQLRGAASDLDQALVEEHARIHDHPIHVKVVDMASIASEKKESLQQLARDIRYSFFEDLLSKENYDICATAHHADDQVENLLMSLLQGNGFPLLRGIPERRGPYVRPMLKCNKSEIYAYLQTEKIAFREDESNQKTDYLRNRFRHEIIPVLEQIQPQTQKHLIERNSWYQYQLKFLEKILIEAFRKAGGDRDLLNWEAFKDAYGIEHLPLLIVFCLDKWGIHGHEMWNASDLMKAQSGKMMLCKSGKLLRTRKGLQFIRKRPEQEVQLINLQVFISFFPNKLNLRIFETEMLIERIPRGNFKSFEVGKLYMDLDKLSLPIKLRPWKHGDKMQPLGMKSHKKVSDILIDEKIELVEKEKCILVEAADEIVGLSDLRVSEKVKIDHSTKELLVFTLQK